MKPTTVAAIVGIAIPSAFYWNAYGRINDTYAEISLEKVEPIYYPGSMIDFSSRGNATNEITVKRNEPFFYTASAKDPNGIEAMTLMLEGNGINSAVSPCEIDHLSKTIDYHHVMSLSTAGEYTVTVEASAKWSWHRRNQIARITVIDEEFKDTELQGILAAYPGECTTSSIFYDNSI